MAVKLQSAEVEVEVFALLACLGVVGRDPLGIQDAKVARNVEDGAGDNFRYRHSSTAGELSRPSSIRTDLDLPLLVGHGRRTTTQKSNK
eukprot:scaffold7262_cov99-Skeletonema_dohrnii-CCMP3373.AAC.1